MPAWVTQLRKGVIELCVLNVLRRGESYGYAVVQQLQALGDLDISESTVYPVLTRLRKDKCVRIRMAPSPEGPPRRYFSLTAAGLERVEMMNDHWASLTRHIRTLQERK